MAEHSIETGPAAAAAARVPCVAVVLTFNCAAIIRETITQALKVTPQVFVVDSFSSDATCSMAQELGCEVVQRKFINYAEQRNWAINQVVGRCGWQLHLDADEVLDAKAIAAITDVLKASPASAGNAYLLKRRDYFMGQELRFSGLSPWHLRLFPSGHGQCEDRLYDQHFLSDLPVKRLPGLMHDKNAQTLSEWVTRHNRWSDLEAEQIGSEVGSGELQPALLGDPRKRTRLLKSLYYLLPGGFRSVLYFLYRYLLRGGFLDGRVGFYFAVFQGFWFRTLVDAKAFERTEHSRVFRS